MVHRRWGKQPCFESPIPSRPKTRPPALQWLASVAQGLAEDCRLWRPRVRHEAECRWVAPLVITEHSEAWLQGWPVGEPRRAARSRWRLGCLVRGAGLAGPAAGDLCGGA